MGMFNRETQPVRGKLIAVRVSEEEKALVEQLADGLGVGGTSEVIRVALDFYMANCPQAKKLLGSRRSGS